MGPGPRSGSVSGGCDLESGRAADRRLGERRAEAAGGRRRPLLGGNTDLPDAWPAAAVPREGGRAGAGLGCPPVSLVRAVFPLSSLEPRHLRLLSLLGAASFFEGYDFNIITVALKPLRMTFGLNQGTASLWIAVVYLGALPAVPAAHWADRRG